MNIPPDYLSKKYPHSRDKHISFDEGPHIYTIDGDSNFMSVTTWNHSHFPKFNANKIIGKMMSSKKWESSQYYGMTKKEIKEKWNKNRDEAANAGTKMHYDIECYYNEMSVNNTSVEFSYFKQFLKEYGHLKPYRTEWMVYDKELKLAGSIDMIFENKDGSLRIYDWKRCKEIKKNNPWQNATTSCITHLSDTNFWHYALQLNTYKYLLEKNYDKRITEMCLVCMHPNNKNKSYIRLEVPDLSDEIENLMKLRMNSLKPNKITLTDINDKLKNIENKVGRILKFMKKRS